jgi:hypothetical protein
LDHFRIKLLDSFGTRVANERPIVSVGVLGDDDEITRLLKNYGVSFVEFLDERRGRVEPGPQSFDNLFTEDGS